MLIKKIICSHQDEFDVCSLIVLRNLIKTRTKQSRKRADICCTEHKNSLWHMQSYVVSLIPLANGTICYTISSERKFSVA